LAANTPLDALFSPNSVAIVGASNAVGKIGNGLVVALKDSPYRGRIYPINPREKLIEGFPAYASLSEIGSPVDFALVVVPPNHVEKVLQDAISAGVKVAQIVSAGFSELGDDGQAIEGRLLELCQNSGMRLIGPNCVGTYSSRSGISWTNRASFGHGGIAILSQSGGLSYDILLGGQEQGLAYSKIVSLGNCMDLDFPDFLEFLADDPETDAIGLYIEGVADGRRFFETLSIAASRKPVYVLKGGTTERGSRSVASHTGRLAGDYRIWKSAIRQARATEVSSVSELLSALKADYYQIRHPKEKGVALVGNGGGATVLATDACEAANLRLAVANEDTRHSLETLIPFAGAVGEGGNPIDLPLPRLLQDGGELFSKIVETLGEDDDVGSVLIHLNLLPLADRMDARELLESVISRFHSVRAIATNPVFVIRSDGSDVVDSLQRFAREQLIEKAGVPVCATMSEGIDVVRHSVVRT
jgi:acyl-CoA synthetase (NDP forming)